MSGNIQFPSLPGNQQWAVEKITPLEQALRRVDAWWYNYRNPTFIASCLAFLVTLLGAFLAASLCLAFLLQSPLIVNEVRRAYGMAYLVQDYTALLNYSVKLPKGVFPVRWSLLANLVTTKFNALFVYTLVAYVLTVGYLAMRIGAAFFDMRQERSQAQQEHDALQGVVVRTQQANDAKARAELLNQERIKSEAAIEAHRAKQQKLDAERAIALQQAQVRIEAQILSALSMRALDFAFKKDSDGPYRELRAEMRRNPRPDYGLLRASAHPEIVRLVTSDPSWLPPVPINPGETPRVLPGAYPQGQGTR